MEEKIQRFEQPEKPEMENIKDIIPDTQDFNEPERAAAVIKNLSLSVGDTVRDEGDGEEYTINPRMVLRGNSPDHYKKSVDNLKKLLDEVEIKAIGRAISRKTKSYNKCLYDLISNKFNTFYWRGNIKKSLPLEIKEVLEIFKEDKFCGIYNTVYHLLSKDESDYIECYKCAWKNKPIPNIQEWREENDGSYRVLTDREADRAAEDWFDGDEFWKMAVEAGNTTLSQSDWEEQVISIDGRGSLLNGYDGCEEYEDVNETTYYIYRTN